MRVVLDTNVIVSALLSEQDPPAQLLDWVRIGELTLVLESRILHEYREVLLRAKFAFEPDMVLALLDELEVLAFTIIARPRSARLPDSEDEIFLAAADQALAALVTDNQRHFPPAERGMVKILSPREAFDELHVAKRS